MRSNLENHRIATPPFPPEPGEGETLKYELTFNAATLAISGTTVYRIKLLKAITVRTEHGTSILAPGTLGGWVHDYSNLSQDGSCWVGDNAVVYGNAKVIENAVVLGKATVGDDAVIRGQAAVLDSASVYENADVCDYATVRKAASVHGHACVKDAALVSAWANVSGSASISTNAIVTAFARVEGSALVMGHATITDSATVTGGAMVLQAACVGGRSVVRDRAVLSGSVSVDNLAEISGRAAVSGNCRVHGHAVVSDDASLIGDFVARGHARICGTAHFFVGAVVDGTLLHSSDVIVLGPIGSRGDVTTFNKTTGTITTGCFIGNIDDLENKLDQTYPEENNRFRNQYMQFIQLVKALLEIDDLPESRPKDEEEADEEATCYDPYYDGEEPEEEEGPDEE